MQAAHFTFWSIVFLIGSAQGFFLSAVLLTSRKSGLSTRVVLSSLILAFSITLLFYVFYWVGISGNFKELFNTALQVEYLFGPLAFLYVKKVGGKNLVKADLLHFIPFILVFSIFGVTAITPLAIENKFIYSHRTFLITNIVLQNFSLFAYSYLIWNWALKSSGRNKKISKFLHQLALLFSFFALSFISYYLLMFTGLLKPQYDYAISVCMSVIIFYIGYKGYFMPEISTGNITANGKYSKSGMSGSMEKHFGEKLLGLLKNEKIYLNSELKLSDLSSELGISVHHLSQVINSYFDQSFSDLINSLRVQQAIHIMTSEDHKEETLIGVAYASGFNNKVSFNNAFRKFTGLSPSLYKKLIQEGKDLPSEIKYPRLEV